MKTSFKNLFITGLLIIVVFSLFKVPYAKAEDNTDYTLLCNGMRTFLSSTLNLGNYRSCPPDSNNIERSTCAPFLMEEINVLRTAFLSDLNCEVADKENTKEVANILCSIEARNGYSSLKIICKYKDNPDEGNTNDLDTVLTSSRLAGGRGGVTPETISGSIVSAQEQKPGSCALDTQFKASMLNIFDWASGGLVYLFYVILRGLLTWVLKIFQFFLNPSNFGGYINFLNFNGGSQQSLVRVLWDYMRNITNIGIIIGMIVVAVSTILGIKKFDWKKNLLKLLVVAVLVNFSLIIAGMFVDISNFASISAVTQFEKVSLPTLFIDKTICPVVQGFYDLGPGAWPLTRAGTMGLVITGIFLFQFVGLLFYLLTRIVTILICLITSPVAFLALAFPGLEKGWDFWRERFQQALVGLPALCITLYLSISFINIVINNLKERSSQGFLVTVAYAAFIVAFVQLPRYVAKFLGIEQVEKGFQFAKKAVIGMTKAGAAAVGGFALGRVITSGAWKNAQTKLKKSNAPPLHGVGNWMDKQSKNFATRKGKQAEELLEGQTEEEINHYMEMNRKSGNKLGVAIGLNELIKRKKLKDKHLGHMNFARSVPTLNVKDAKKANPLLFAEFSHPITPTSRANIARYISHNRGITDPQELNTAVQETIKELNLKRVLAQAGESKTSDLEKGNWQNIFEETSALGEERLESFLYNLEEKTGTPEALAAIFKTLDGGVVRNYVNHLIGGVMRNRRCNRQEAIDYLLETKRFRPSTYWRSLLGGSTSEDQY